MGANLAYCSNESTNKLSIENKGLEFAFGVNNKQCSVAQGEEGAPLGKKVDDRKPINWKDSKNATPQVGTIG